MSGGLSPQKGLGINIVKLFTKHLDEVGETYLAHAHAALSISCRCLLVVYNQFLHAIFPFIAPMPGTDVRSLIKYLEKKLPENRKGNDYE